MGRLRITNTDRCLGGTHNGAVLKLKRTLKKMRSVGGRLGLLDQAERSEEGDIAPPVSLVYAAAGCSVELDQ